MEDTGHPHLGPHHAAQRGGYRCHARLSGARHDSRWAARRHRRDHRRAPRPGPARGRLPPGPAVRFLGIRAAITAANILAATAALALLADGRLPTAIGYCLLAGISLGAASALQGIYTSQLADPRHLGMLFGAQQAAYGTGGAADPALGAALLALTGSYRLVMALAAAGSLASAALLRPASPPSAAPGRPG